MPASPIVPVNAPLSRAISLHPKSLKKKRPCFARSLDMRCGLMFNY